MSLRSPSFRNDDRRPTGGRWEREASREAEYLRRLVAEKTPVVVHLRTGESFRGFIEYYDRQFIRLTRQRAPNLFLFKQDIKYFCEE